MTLTASNSALLNCDNDDDDDDIDNDNRQINGKDGGGSAKQTAK